MKEYLTILHINGQLELTVNGNKEPDIGTFVHFPIDQAVALEVKLKGNRAACEIHRVRSDVPPTSGPTAASGATLCMKVDRDNSSKLKKIRIRARPRTRKLGNETVPPGSGTPSGKRRAKKKNSKFLSYAKGLVTLDIKA